jgi:hypothetical protein
MAGVVLLDLMPSRVRDYVPRDLEPLGTEGGNLSAVVYRPCQEKERDQDLVDWLSELCAPELADIDFVEADLGDVMMVRIEKKGARTSRPKHVGWHAAVPWSARRRAHGAARVDVAHRGA